MFVMPAFFMSNLFTTLLYRDGFCQISGLIAVMPSQDGQVITQQL
jgi:hypothetical protein